MTPETRPSLIVRLRDCRDADAWYDFVDVYRPVIVSVARSRGLQLADAEDLAQGVLVSVAGAIERFDPDGPARFRTWLRKIAENAILNAITRRKPDVGVGGDVDETLLQPIATPDTLASTLLRTEYRSGILRWAAKRIRPEFSDVTWKAFWMTAVEGAAAEQVGRRLGRNRGSIYAARSRVMKRLLAEVAKFEDEHDE